MSKVFSAYKRFKSRTEEGVKTLGERGRGKGEGKKEWRRRKWAVGKNGGRVHWWFSLVDNSRRCRKSGIEVC